MKNFVSSQVELKALEATGVVNHFQAATIDEAVAKQLYTSKLNDSEAFVGPTGRVVYEHDFAWAVTTEKPMFGRPLY